MISVTFILNIHRCTDWCHGCRAGSVPNTVWHGLARPLSAAFVSWSCRWFFFLTTTSFCDTSRVSQRERYPLSPSACTEQISLLIQAHCLFILEPVWAVKRRLGGCSLELFHQLPQFESCIFFQLGFSKGDKFIEDKISIMSLPLKYSVKKKLHSQCLLLKLR